MKKSISFFLALFFLSTFIIPLKAEDHEVDAKSDLDKVTVYRQGARVFRKGKVNVKRGRNKVVFPKLENGIDPNSIQAGGPVDLVILSVEYQLNYRKSPEKTKRYESVKDSLELLRYKRMDLGNERTVLEKERDMILQNQRLAGEKTAVSVVELTKAADFFRNRLTDIYNRLHKIQKKDEGLARTEARLKQEFASMGGGNALRGEPSHEIVVTIDAPLNANIFLNLDYYVSGASWIPRYDLRAADLDKPVQLDYRADINQNTGIEWDDVKLTLSSGNPRAGGTAPTMSPWYLSLYDPNAYRGYGRNDGAPAMEAVTISSSKPRPKRRKETYEAEEADEYGGYDVGTIADYTTVAQTATTTEYEISLRQDVPSDGDYHRVLIRKEELPAEFRHYSVPKLDARAFLVARVTGWEDLDLQAGEASIYLEGTFVGKSMLNPAVDEDTLSFSLGSDPRVMVERKQLKDYRESKFLGLNKQKTYAWEITVRNTKKQPINLELLDQYPISNDEKIEVKLEDAGNASVDKEKGFLTWKMEIGAGETKKVRFIYWVKYPKKFRVTGL